MVGLWWIVRGCGWDDRVVPVSGRGAIAYGVSLALCVLQAVCGTRVVMWGGEAVG